jgi:CheY-like chemotaxis protein
MSNKSIAKIVLAEDEEIISMAYQHGLTYLGFEVVLAKDGLEAIAAVEAEKPDVLLLDIIMPNLNGIEALKKIRGNPTFASLPIIMLTNLSQPSDEAMARELGATDYLIKSDITLDQLTEHINQALEARS